MENQSPVVYFVIPCYNEGGASGSGETPDGELDSMRERAGVPESRILFVDDGSKDKTWELISQFQEKPLVEGSWPTTGAIKTPAVRLMTATACDCAITMDADLRTTPTCWTSLYRSFGRAATWYTVCANKRDTDTWFKRTTAEGFYKVMKLLGVDVVFSHCRLPPDEQTGPGRPVGVSGSQPVSAGHCTADRLPQRLCLLRPAGAVCRGEANTP
ncbi:MAG: glycosyltransferase [Oscillospiraceae bacterium]